MEAELTMIMPSLITSRSVEAEKNWELRNDTKLHSGTSPATYEQQVMIAFFIVVMGLWSTFGNLLTILAIAFHTDMQTKCNAFLLSLATSDLLSGLVASPLWLYRRTWGFYDWQLGQFLCKLFWFTDESTSYCTSMHIASFAVWRLIGVKWPLRFEAIKFRVVKLWLGLLWLFALVFGGFLFTLFYDITPKDGSEVVSRSWPSCSIKISDDGIERHRVYYTFSSATFMFVPLAVLIIASSLLVRELYAKRAMKSTLRRRKEKKASIQLALIASSFLIGYLPMTIYVMWTTRTAPKNPHFDYWLNVISYFFLRLSECINPLVYNIASGHMRRASMDVLKRIRNCRDKHISSEYITPRSTPAARRRENGLLLTPSVNANIRRKIETQATFHRNSPVSVF